MTKLIPIDDNIADVFDKCIVSVMEPKKSEILTYRGDIIAKTFDYTNLLILDSFGIKDNTLKDNMTFLYNNHFVKVASSGREFYEKIMLIPKNSKCPFCNIRDVRTIDHFLPKSIVPELAITPINLVACCSDCNKAKRDQLGNFIHPYYDDISKIKWLDAKVDTKSGTVMFFVNQQLDFNKDLKNKIINQFNTLGLAKLYANNFASELDSMRFRLEEVYIKLGVNSVNVTLNDLAKSCLNNNLNCYKGVGYEALAKDIKFCNGGFINP